MYPQIEIDKLGHIMQIKSLQYIQNYSTVNNDSLLMYIQYVTAMNFEGGKTLQVVVKLKLNVKLYSRTNNDIAPD